jgi:hypothetical protein
MICRLPTVDSATHPHVANLVSTYASRYEFRLDGSSLWEGRARYGHYPSESPAGTSAARHAYEKFVQRQTSYPVLQVPPAFIPLTGDDGVCGYYRCDVEQAILAYQRTDIFVVQHPDVASYLWELAQIRAAEFPSHPRELLTGFTHTLSHRARLVHEIWDWL